MLTTPILSEIKTFSATIPYEFTFNVRGGSQVVANNLVIERISDNAEIYNQTQESFSFRHELPADTLVNGVNYRIKVRTKDISGKFSNFSASLLFWCYSKPSLYITTINYDDQNRVYNQTVIFETIYSQSENELLQSYRYLLYDENKNLLSSFPEHYSDGNDMLTQEIAGLENGRLYYIEVITLSPNGNMGTSGLINFKPFYIAPKFTITLTPENLIEQGAVKISANILQIILKLYDDMGNQINPFNVQYIDNEWINMNRIDYDKLVADEGFNILSDDFILQLWCKELPESKVFLTLFSPQGKIEMFKFNNKIRLYKYINNLDFQGYYVSDDFELDSFDQELMIHVKQENQTIDIIVETL